MRKVANSKAAYRTSERKKGGGAGCTASAGNAGGESIEGGGRLANTRVVMTCIAPEVVRELEGAEARGHGDAGCKKGEFSATPARLSLVATRDLYDRAHNVRDGSSGLLVPAAKGSDIFGSGVRMTLNGQAKARRYPACHVVGLPGNQVSHDSAAEDLDERQRWLMSQGLSVGGRGSVAEMRDQALNAMVEVRMRDIVARKTRQRDVVTGAVVKD